MRQNCNRKKNSFVCRPKLCRLALLIFIFESQKAIQATLSNSTWYTDIKQNTKPNTILWNGAFCWPSNAAPPVEMPIPLPPKWGRLATTGLRPSGLNSTQTLTWSAHDRQTDGRMDGHRLMPLDIPSQESGDDRDWRPNFSVHMAAKMLSPLLTRLDRYDGLSVAVLRTHSR